jgi:hypothetical protein
MAYNSDRKSYEKNEEFYEKKRKHLKYVKTMGGYSERGIV